MSIQQKIDDTASLRIGWTAAERKKNPKLTVKREDTRKTIADLAALALKLNREFYEFIESLFPQLGPITKGVDVATLDVNWSECKCCEVVSKVAEFTPTQADRISELFRSNYPRQWGQLNSYANDWVNGLMNGNTPNMGAPFSAGYWEMLQQGSGYAYEQALQSWPNPSVPLPFVVSAGEDFIKSIYVDGYNLVTSQITQNALPSAMNTINTALSQGRNYTEITADLKAQFGATNAHWLRLVRTEMAIAANAGTMAQARELNEPATAIKWSTSAGSVCPICAPRNGVLYDLDAAELNGIPHPNCKCVRVITFRKRASSLAPKPDPSKPVGPEGTGLGKAKITGSHNLTQDELAELQSHADAKLKQYGINDNIEIKFGNLKNGNAGQVSLPMSKVGELKKIGSMDIHNKEYSNMKYKDVISHELKHVQQINSGRMAYTREGTYWDGKLHTSRSEYTRTVNKVSGKTAKTQAEMDAALEKYKTWPWEKEAYATAGR